MFVSRLMRSGFYWRFFLSSVYRKVKAWSMRNTESLSTWSIAVSLCLNIWQMRAEPLRLPGLRPYLPDIVTGICAGPSRL